MCRFTFADGRQCRTPRSPHHPHFCSDHARKDSQARAADKLARDLFYFFSGEYLSTCDLSAALGRLLPVGVRGDIKPRSARALAYLSQTLAQTIHLAQDEYANALGAVSWRTAVRNSVCLNFDYRNASSSTEPPPDQAPHVVAGLPRSMRPGSIGKTGEGQAPQPSPSPPTGPIAVHSHASHEHPIHSSCCGRCLAFCASRFRPGRPVRTQWLVGTCSDSIRRRVRNHPSPNPFRCNTYRMSASVDSKPFTQTLCPLDAPLIKNAGGRNLQRS